MGWLKDRYENSIAVKEREELTGIPFNRKKYPGKTTCDVIFVYAFIIAKEMANKKESVVTYRGVTVSPDKDLKE